MKLYAKSTPEHFKRFKNMSKWYELRQLETFTVEDSVTGKQCTREIISVEQAWPGLIAREEAENVEFEPDELIYAFKLGRKL